MNKKQLDKAIKKLLEERPNQEKKRRNYTKLAKSRKKERIKQSYRGQNYGLLERRINNSIKDELEKAQTELAVLENLVNENTNTSFVFAKEVEDEKRQYIHGYYNYFPSKKIFKEDCAEIQKRRTANHLSLRKPVLFSEAKCELVETIREYTLTYINANGKATDQYNISVSEMIPYNYIEQKIEFSQFAEMIEKLGVKIRRPSTEFDQRIRELKRPYWLYVRKRKLNILLDNQQPTEKEKFLLKQIKASFDSRMYSAVPIRKKTKLRSVLRVIEKEQNAELAQVDLLSGKKDVFSTKDFW